MEAEAALVRKLGVAAVEDPTYNDLHKVSSRRFPQQDADQSGSCCGSDRT